MSRTEHGVIEVEGNEIRISHPDKKLWPEAGITKVGYLQKLVILAPYLLKYCRNRYLTTIRYPGGAGGTFFIKKMRLSRFLSM